VEYDRMSSSVGSCKSYCQRGEELLLGVITGKGRDCQMESALGPPFAACSGGGVWGACAWEATGG